MSAFHLQDGASSNTSLQIVDLRARLVDVKGPNDNHLRWRCEIPVADALKISGIPLLHRFSLTPLRQRLLNELWLN